MATVFDRFFEGSECKTQRELAEMLGVSQALVSDARRRGAIPDDWLMTLVRLKNLNPEWVLLGTGSPHNTSE